MKQMNFERIKSQVFRSSNINVNLMILPNRKGGGNGNQMLTASYIRSYPSNRYVDQTQLQELAINYGAYLEIEYLNFDGNNKRHSSSVLVSYPHLESLSNFLLNTVETFSENFDTIYPENKYIPSEWNSYFESEHLIGGKQLLIAPTFVDITVNNMTVTEPGVVIAVAEEAYSDSITWSQFYGLVNDLVPLLDNGTFRTHISMLYTQAQLDYLISNIGGVSMGGGAESPVFDKPSSGGGMSARSGGFGGGRRTGVTRRKPNSSIPRQDDVETEVSEEQPTTPARRGLGNVGPNRRTVGSPTPPPVAQQQTKSPVTSVDVEEVDISELSDELGGTPDPFIDNVRDVEEDFTPSSNPNTGFGASLLDAASKETFDLDDEDLDL